MLLAVNTVARLKEERFPKVCSKPPPPSHNQGGRNGLQRKHLCRDVKVHGRNVEARQGRAVQEKIAQWTDIAMRSLIPKKGCFCKDCNRRIYKGGNVQGMMCTDGMCKDKVVGCTWTDCTRTDRTRIKCTGPDCARTDCPRINCTGTQSKRGKKKGFARKQRTRRDSRTTHKHSKAPKKE